MPRTLSDNTAGQVERLAPAMLYEAVVDQIDAATGFIVVTIPKVSRAYTRRAVLGTETVPGAGDRVGVMMSNEGRLVVMCRIGE